MKNAMGFSRCLCHTQTHAHHNPYRYTYTVFGLFNITARLIHCAKKLAKPWNQLPSTKIFLKLVKYKASQLKRVSFLKWSRTIFLTFSFDYKIQWVFIFIGRLLYLSSQEVSTEDFDCSSLRSFNSNLSAVKLF